MEEKVEWQHEIIFIFFVTSVAAFSIFEATVIQPL